MVETNDLLKILDNEYDRFSKGQKLIAKYINDHYDKTVLMTAAKLSASVGVSESTVVRFAIKLGFKGYPDFQKALAGAVRSKLNTIQRIAITEDRVGYDKTLGAVLKADYENLKKTREEIDYEEFNKAVEMLGAAKRIYIVAGRSCSMLSSFMGYYFHYIFEDVRVVGQSSLAEILEEVHRIGEEDVIVGISFPRYSMDTVKALQFARRQGAKVIALTDGKASPLCDYSDCNLYAKSDMASFADSFVAPLSVVNALVVALSLKHKTRVLKTMEKLEGIWTEFDVYKNKSVEDSEDE